MPSTSVTSQAVDILRIIEGLWQSCNDGANGAHPQYPEQLPSFHRWRCLSDSPRQSRMRPQELTDSSWGGAENSPAAATGKWQRQGLVVKCPARRAIHKQCRTRSPAWQRGVESWFCHAKAIDRGQVYKALQHQCPIHEWDSTHLRGLW